MKTIGELVSACEIISSNCDMKIPVSDIRYDSRKVGANDAFVCIKGFKSDGHDYAGQAVGAGASVVISETALSGDIPHIVVADTRKTLATMSSAYFDHPAEKMKVVGVTGTNGKTTTTHLIKIIVEHATGAKAGLIGTNGNMIGDEEIETERTTPESYELHKLFSEMARAGCEFVVMEVSSHSLALDRVCGIAFEAGVFTNLTQDHLDFHQTMDEYKRAKSILFSRCKTSVVNLDDNAAAYFLEKSAGRKLTYSASKNEASVVSKNIKLRSGGVEFEAVMEGAIGRVSLAIPGMFSVYNALAAVTCAHALGIELCKITAAVKTAAGVKGRFEVVGTPSDCTVIIDYAHTPDGIENVLKTVKGFADGRVVALFGCGGDRDKTKRPKMAAACAAHADFCIITSDNPRSEDPLRIIGDILPGIKKTSCPYAVIPDRREAIRFALENGKPRDYILLLGKGHETYQEINGMKNHFDEREEVASFFAEKDEIRKTVML